MKIRPKQIDLYTDSTFISDSHELIPSQKATKDFVNSVVNGSVGVIDLTHADARQRMNNGTLKSGNFYRLTDYQTKHVIPNTSTINTGTIEILILLANSTNTFNAIAYSTMHKDDVIEYDITNELCEDGITSRKGFITNRIDTKRNLKAPFDFRNVKFRRFEMDTVSITWSASTTYTKNQVVLQGDSLYISLVDGNISASFDSSKWASVYNTADFFGRYIISNNSYTIGATTINKTTNFTDYSPFASGCTNISIKDDSTGLNNIIVGSNCDDIHFDSDSSGNTIGSSCYHINIGSNSDNNVIGNSAVNIHTQAGASNNLISSNNNIYIGIETTNMRISTGVSNVKIGRNTTNVTIADNCSNIEIGNDCSNIIINKTSTHISFGNDCDDVYFLTTCNRIKFADLMKNKSFSNSVTGIVFLLADSISKTYTITGEQNIVIDTKSPNGEMWYKTMEDDGTMSVQNLA